jgi:hypothetical protein
MSASETENDSLAVGRGGPGESGAESVPSVSFPELEDTTACARFYVVSPGYCNKVLMTRISLLIRDSFNVFAHYVVSV